MYRGSFCVRVTENPTDAIPYCLDTDLFFFYFLPLPVRLPEPNDKKNRLLGTNLAFLWFIPPLELTQMQILCNLFASGNLPILFSLVLIELFHDCSSLFRTSKQFSIYQI